MSFVVAAFYHFFDFQRVKESRAPLLALFKQHDIKGSLLIAPEGINGTLSGTRENIDTVLAYIKENITHEHFVHKESLCDLQPFGRAKVRLKKEVISLGEPVHLHRHPRLARESQATQDSGSRSPHKVGMTGTYVSPQDWNALISDPDTVLIDARNDYEVHLGTFDRAIDPNIKNFKQLPEFVRENLNDAKTKKIATFCTGGIRCEKFSSWLLEQGFEHVYQLYGGILKYLEDMPKDKSKWHGECYVFDERVAVGHGLTPSSTASMCKGCGHALTPEDHAHPAYVENKSCGFCLKG